MEKQTRHLHPGIPAAFGEETNLPEIHREFQAMSRLNRWKEHKEREVIVEIDPETGLQVVVTKTNW